jgi:uncharacterized cupredoxin-like copper-binding protein
VRRLVSALALAVLVGACETGAPGTTPPISPGTGGAPREVNLIARDYEFIPAVVELAPGETILLHVINGGLVIHEAIVGDAEVQDAWEAAEAAAAGAPPGPTPVVTVPAGLEGLRVVVRSGERVDVRWTVPADPAVVGRLIIGCHIPGHWALGMRAGVRAVGGAGPS